MSSCTLYALSTCSHCKKAKKFLEEHNVPFECIYLDTLQGQERQDVIAVVKKFNPRISFPTVVFNNGDKVVVGYEPADLEEALEANE